MANAAQWVHWNLVLGWAWILAGFISGFGMGLFFHREDWLGGYGSFKRRLYRLGHISFFGLAAVNLLFYFTARLVFGEANAPAAAAGLFMLGAITMPLVCLLVAHWTNWRMLFAVPVLSLLAGGLLTVWKLISL